MIKLYTVRLVRPVFQSVTLEVQAWSPGSAAQKALRRAGSLTDADWKTPESSRRDYGVHVEATIDNQAIYESSPNPHREIREFRSGIGQANTIRYLILAADLKTRTGQVLPQPWFLNEDPLLQADCCSDWVETLDFIVENDGLDDDIAPAAVGNELQGNEDDNVIEFPRSDDEVVEPRS